MSGCQQDGQMNKEGWCDGESKESEGGEDIKVDSSTHDITGRKRSPHAPRACAQPVSRVACNINLDRLAGFLTHGPHLVLKCYLI